MKNSVLLYRMILSFLWRNLKNDKILLCISQVFWCIMYSIEPILLPVILGKIFSGLQNGNVNYHWFFMFYLANSLFIICFLIIGQTDSILFPNFETKIRSRVFKHIQNLPFDFFLKSEEGAIIRKIEILVENSTMILEQFIKRFFPAIISLVIACFKLTLLNYQLGLILFGWFLIHLYCCFYGYYKISLISFSQVNIHGRISGLIGDSVKGMLVQDILNIKNQKLQELEKLHVIERKAHKTLKLTSEKIRAIKSFFYLLLLFFVCTTLIGLILKKMITFEDFIVCFNVVLGISVIIWRASEKLPETFNSLGKCKAAFELVQIKPNEEKQNIIQKEVGEIKIENLCCFYEHKSSPIIESLSLSLKNGESLLIAGQSGVGKTTFVNCLYGLIDYHGSIQFDFTEVSSIKREFFTQYCNFIPSKKVIFSGSILNNLFCDDLKEVEKISKLCLLDKVIDQMRDGLDSDVGTAGSILSEGQKQRLNIARSILRHKTSKVLIMDEVVNSLDQTSADIILSNIMKLYEGKTIICVDHSFKFLPYCSKVLFFQQNEILLLTKEEALQNKNFMKLVNSSLSIMEEC
jgi:ATP-binding cassette subfamily B protein